jgi:hypothetical protein
MACGLIKYLCFPCYIFKYCKKCCKRRTRSFPNLDQTHESTSTEEKNQEELTIKRYSNFLRKKTSNSSTSMQKYIKRLDDSDN